MLRVLKSPQRRLGVLIQRKQNVLLPFLPVGFIKNARLVPSWCRLTGKILSMYRYNCFFM